MDRYVKALEQARNFYPDNLFLDIIFPELAESEDERIMKFLKDYAIEMIAGLESDISISVYDGVKGHDPEAEAELEKWKGVRAWLEKQKEQKPAEWSEKDFNIRNNLADYLTGELKLTEKAKMDGASWLKSLRPQPHWKPSEEQIRRLNNVIITDSSIWGVETKRAMKSLYEDLKKL